MEKRNILKEKSFQLAVGIVELSKFLQEKKEFILSKQLLRSGTAVGALIREAEFAQSKADFINKLQISLKEANETLYWLDLLKVTNYIEINNFKLHSEITKENISLLVSSINTVKKNLQNEKLIK